jgi:hypothetical protein
MQAALKNRASAAELAALRSQLRERFGAAASGDTAPAKTVPPPLPTGIPSWDAAGGLRQGQLTEACGGTAEAPAEAVEEPMRRLISMVCGTAFSRG